MRNYLNGFIIAALALLLSTQVFAADDTTTKELHELLKKNYPQLQIEEITPSPIEGIYQVVASGNIVYVTEDGQFLIAGDIYDLNNIQNNRTEMARKKMRLKTIQNMKPENMIIFEAKKPEYTITVFTDVDCSYCRKFQAEVQKINDLGITVRYLAFPRTGIDSPTAEKMIKIWCAKDKKQALKLAMEDKPFEGSICPDLSVAYGFQLGQSMGINGTPTTIFEDGTLYAGNLPAEKLAEVVRQIHQQSHQQTKK